MLDLQQQKLIKILALLALLAFVSAARAQTTGAARVEPDFQLWNDTQIIVPLDKEKQWNATLWIFGRAGDNARLLTDARIGGLLTKRVNKYLTVGGAYLSRYANSTLRRKVYDNRFLGVATATVPLGKKFSLINRNIYQYESRNSRADTTVLRSRFWLTREISVTREKKIQPFVAFEQFYDLRLDAFARNRIQIGATHRFNPKFGADFFYVRQNEGGKNTRPGSLNGIGTTFRINF